MDRVSRILPRVLVQRGLRGEADASSIVTAAGLWLRQALPAFADAIHCKTYKDGVLVVACDHSIASQECRELLPELLLMLHDRFPALRIDDVRLVRS
jgi:hypothetical protein